MSDFGKRLALATPSNQTDWIQYQCFYDTYNNVLSGYPFGEATTVDDKGNTVLCNVGMNCYNLVSHVLVDAGANIDPVAVDAGGGCSYFFSHYHLVASADVQLGDIVLFDFNKNGQYKHSGIITRTGGETDPKKFQMISSDGLVDYFNLGAAETTVGVFEDILSTHGGVAKDSYNIAFVRPTIEPN